jgi:hypothetical protein
MSSLMSSLRERAAALVGKPRDFAPAARMVDVGWILDVEKGGMIWHAPKRLSRVDSDVRHVKSLRFCPAMIDYEARTFEIACPFDLRIRLSKDDKGQPMLINALGDRSPIRGNHLGKMVHLVSPKEWRDPDKPVIQINAPYLFIADEPVWMNQMPPFNHYRAEPWPGLFTGGRFPIDVWPRHLMWAFEWHDTSKDLELKRGEPWFYARFETWDPSRPVRLVEAEMTPALREHINACSTVTNYVGRTFSLFETARERRPAKLLTPKVR